jgi:hypothetical protein
MDTEVINELLQMVTESQMLLDGYKRHWLTINGAESEIVKADKKLQLYQKCIDQLNRLKDFEWPTDEEISERTSEIQNDCCIRHYIYGSTDMRETIKTKLEDGI